MNIEQIKQQQRKFYMLCNAMSKEQALNYVADVVQYIFYLMGQDGVISKQEADFVHKVLMIEQDQILEYCNDINWEHFQSNIPASLLFFIEIDKKVSCPYENSISRNYIDFLENLGTAFIAIDDRKDVEVQAVKNYVDWITTYAKQALAKKRPDPASIFANTEFDLEGKPTNDPFAVGNSGHKTDQSSKDGKKTAANEARKKPAPKGGNWIPTSEHIPTGNFLDDVFRHAALSHEDRVSVWEQLTTDSLPSVMLDDLSFTDFAMFGSAADDNVSLDESYEEYAIKDNKPVYYYASGIKAYLPEDDTYIPAGFAVHHQGIFLYWELGLTFFPWDDLYLKMELEREKGFDVIDIGCSMKFAFDRTFNQNELKNLLMVLNIRLEQIKPFRGKPFLEEDPDWYRFINDHVAMKLCEDYLKNKGAKPGKSSQSQPPKPDKPAKRAEKKAESPKPQPVAPKPASKASGAVSIPTAGPTTKLDFWQAFKPYIDQMRHTEFSKVKLKDDDCLDAKPTVIVGVYNSILMRVSKHLLRLELYIDTDSEAGNLQILDYIKAKIKVPPALKGKIEYERKEGRRAQRVCVSFPGFELSNRSCWGKYITEIMSVADDFFDAVEAPMRDLIG